jgi:hypothetical protein
MRPFGITGALLVLVTLIGACGPADRAVPTEQSRAAAPLAPAASVVAPPGQNFVAHLSGDNEVPARDTPAQGEIKLQLNANGDTLEYKIISSNIDNVRQAHIHIAAAGTNGPIVVCLFGPVAAGGGRRDGVLKSGTISDANFIGPLAGHPLSDLIRLIRLDSAYANVHTDDGLDGLNTGPGDFPGGEIRGQIRALGPKP